MINFNIELYLFPEKIQKKKKRGHKKILSIHPSSKNKIILIKNDTLIAIH